MNFEISDTRKTIAHSIREFAKKHIRPFMMDWDEKQTFPEDLFHKLGEMGYMGVLVPEKYGGSEMDYHEYITVIEEISKVDSASLWTPPMPPVTIRGMPTRSAQKMVPETVVAP